MQGPSPIPVFRPAKLSPGPEFQGSLVESPANVFYQKVTASRATLDRMQFQWRSVSDNLLVSPVVRIRFLLNINCPQLWTHLTSTIPLQGLAQLQVNGLATYPALAASNAGIGKVAPPCLVFADGDAFTSCCSSISLNFNGTSLSLNRTNRFWRDWQRTQLSSEDSARIYKRSGGSYDMFDSRAVVTSGTVLPVAAGVSVVVNTRARAEATLCAGVTQDSGISDRSKALYSAIKDQEVINDTTRSIYISYPVPVAPLNPWHGYVLPASCPYKNCPLAIPHLSAGGLDILMEDFATSFIRKLGGSLTAGGAGGVAGAQSAIPTIITMGDKNECVLELKYFRLSHTRTLKESYRFNVWQTQTFNGPDPPTIAAVNNGHVDTTADYIAMRPMGKDPVTAITSGVSMMSKARADHEWQFSFNALNLAQVPSFLLISVPRLSECYTMGDDRAAGSLPNCLRNLSRNLYIKDLKIVVNSARGAIDGGGADKTGFVNAERLFEMTQENAGSHYFKEGGFRAWRDFGCAVLLNSTQFAPGLQVSDGVAYPIQVQIDMTVQNRCVDVCAEKLLGPVDVVNVGIGAANLATDHTGAKIAPALVADYIRARAQATCFFTKIVLATTETSGTTNAMNYPLDSAERLMNSAGQMR